VLVSIIIAGLVMGAIYGMVGLGYSIIFRASGIMNLAQSEMVTLASLIGVTLYQTLGLPFWLSLALTMVIMFLFGALLQVGIVSRFNERGVKGIYMVLVTLGLSKIMNGSCELIFGANPVRFPPIFSVSTVKVLGTIITPERILSFFLSALAMLAIHLFLTRTKTGIATRACASDALAAEACGINVVNSNAIVWGLASASAAICGMMLGPIYGAAITLGSKVGTKGMASSVSGGFGNIYGAMVGGLLLGMVESFVGGYVNSTMKDMVAYLLLFLMLCVRPTGLFNEQAIRDV
jgi:branched-chain amino acid transport system permease protein